VYAVSVLAITVVPFRLHRHRHAPWWLVVQLVPFDVPPWSFALNILMFVPFGLLLPLIWRRAGSFARVLAGSLAASTVIELTQLVQWITLGNYRTVDVNDLIANTAGGLLGYAILRLTTSASRLGCSPRASSPDSSTRPAQSSSTRPDSR
jgi:glycopeptide antibiotics resistance protein